MNRRVPIFKVIGTEATLGVCADDNWILSLNVPVANPVPTTFGDTVTIPGAAPVNGLNVSHDAAAEADHEAWPVPWFVTAIFWLAGLKPTAPKKVIDVGDAARKPDCTASVTGIVKGELVAPGELIFSDPL